MQRKKWFLVAAATAILTCAAAFCACESGDGTANANGNANGSANGNSSPCDLPDTPQNYLPCGTEISAEDFVVNREENTLYLKIPNEQTTFSFLNKINVSENSQWKLYSDIECTQEIVSKTTSVKVGDNVFYILVTQGNHLSLYTATVRRRPVYTVSFKYQSTYYENNYNTGTYYTGTIDTQQIEEDDFAVQPADPTLRGYAFSSWNYDFSEPVTKNTSVFVKFDLISYKIFYSYGDGNNPENNPATYTIQDSVELSAPLKKGYTGKWDNNGIIQRGSTGDKTFTASYTINRYQVNVAQSLDACSLTGSGDYDYASAVTLEAAPYLGYKFDGWYNGETLLCKDNRYSFILPDENVSLTAKLSVLPEMLNYNFTSTTTTCIITSVKDTTVTSAIIPDYVTGIGNSAFAYCSGLTELKIPNSVTSIAYNAFASCSNLTKISIPDSLMYMGTNVFKDCSRLQYNEYDNAYYLGNEQNPAVVLFQAKNTEITDCTINEQTKIIYDNAFSGCKNLSGITLPQGLINIGAQSFYNCTGITNIIIPDGVTKIGGNAFSGCPIKAASIPSSAIGYIPKNYLTSVIITSGNYIGDRAFKDCNGLTTVTILNSVKSIDIEAFYYCRNLTTVTIPNSVKSIENGAFRYCSNLTSITFTGTMAQWQAISKYNYYWNDGTGNYTVYCTDGNITK